ncbi:hypothetical protein LC605_29870, partial [Nostoc sp. CHAB 5836]|uniref:hypothetical protein n=1 Tax=Nostoc sp. CHAB 5836 TaxID=2780404 RepID=UPI001E5FFDBB
MFHVSRFMFHAAGMLFHGVSRPETLMKPLKRFMKRFMKQFYETLPPITITLMPVSEMSILH